MSFRSQNQRGGASGSAGSSLQERFRQMNEQEKLIEQKKREIEQRMLAQKMKEQEEALKKIQPKKKEDHFVPQRRAPGRL